jgi:hypothetical protein
MSPMKFSAGNFQLQRTRHFCTPPISVDPPGLPSRWSSAASR